MKVNKSQQKTTKDYEKIGKNTKEYERTRNNAKYFKVISLSQYTPPGGIPPPPGAAPPAPGVQPPRPPIQKKPNPAPPKKMKNFFWSKIPDAQISPTIWKHIDDRDVQFDVDEFVTEFCAPVSATSPKEKKDKPSAPKTVELIDSNKARSVAIILSRFKMTNEDIANSIKKSFVINHFYVFKVTNKVTAYMGSIPGNYKRIEFIERC